MKKLLTLNLGTSYTTRQPILDEILVRLPNTLNLACASIILAVLVGVPCGIITALKKDIRWPSLTWRRWASPTPRTG